MTNKQPANDVRSGLTPDRYIIVGNFRSTPDDAGDDYVSVPSGVHIGEFYSYMRAYARVHKLLIVDYLDDGIVLRGKADAMRKLTRDTGGHYSCVCVGDTAFNELLKLRGRDAMPISA